MLHRAVKISKFLSFLLRHGSEEFGLAIDEHGFAAVADVLLILRQKYGRFSEEELHEVIRTDPKGRYEMTDRGIRARYGHSVDVTPSVHAAAPPTMLYHGTSGKDLPFILRQGLRPMRRRFVHLSRTIHEACNVGRRHSRNVALLQIAAAEAHAAGIEFFRESNTYLARHIPPEFITVIETPPQAER